MTPYQTHLESVARIKTREQWAYALGYINADYAHNVITSAQYDILFELLTLKERLI